jgi:glucosamine 6-phosphate synthetase-like amidotransferase/phosphosugar isomerase protein
LPFHIIDNKISDGTKGYDPIIRGQLWAMLYRFKTKKMESSFVESASWVKLNKISDDIIFVPDIEIDYTPFINVVCLQLLAYHIANFKKRIALKTS